MKCTSQIQADRVAQAGAKKMNAQDYTLFAPFAQMLPIEQQNVFMVITPEGEEYLVNVQTRFCTCPFHLDNTEYKTCKHLVWADQKKAQQIEAA